MIEGNGGRVFLCADDGTDLEQCLANHAVLERVGWHLLRVRRSSLLVAPHRVVAGLRKQLLAHGIHFNAAVQAEDADVQPEAGLKRRRAAPGPAKARSRSARVVKSEPQADAGAGATAAPAESEPSDSESQPTSSLDGLKEASGSSSAASTLAAPGRSARSRSPLLRRP